MHQIAKLLLIFFYFEISVNGLRFFVEKNTHKCIRDEVHRDVLVTGDFKATSVGSLTTSIDVKDSNSNILFQKSDIKEGKFSFTTENFDVFDVCFYVSDPNRGSRTDEKIEVYLSLKHGVEAKDLDSLGKAEKLKPIEVELRKLEFISDSVVKDFIGMHERSENMRYTNESTHSRVLYFSIFSMICLIGLACWQVMYLRNYFKSKKLIE